MIVRQSPLSSALNRSIRGEAAGYETAEYLLIGILNQLRNISWQTGHGKGEKPPEPIYPPGVENPNESKTVGDVMSIDEMDARLAPYLPRRADEPS